MEFIEEYNGSASFKAFIQPWVVCFAASLFFFYEFIQGNMFASIADNIMGDFSIQVDKVTYLSTVYYCSNVVFLLFAGQILDRFSTKKTMIVAMFLCVFSTFTLAYTDSYVVALCCRFVTGIGSAFCFLGPIRVASRWFPPQRMALITGLVVTIGMTGGMLAQRPLTDLVVSLGWRESVSLVAWLGVVLLVLMSVLIKDKPQHAVAYEHKTQSPLSVARKAYFNTQSLRAALYTSLMNMGIAVFGAMLGPLYLVQRLDVTKKEAAMVNTMLFIGAIIGGPCMGWISDKISLRLLPMKIGSVAALVVVLGIIYMPVSLTLMAGLFFLLGFFTASQVISYAMVAESNPPAMTATAVSLISILTQGGYILYQNLFSWILLFSGSVKMIDHVPVYSPEAYKTAAILIPIGLLIALSLVYQLKETHCKQKVF